MTHALTLSTIPAIALIVFLATSTMVVSPIKLLTWESFWGDVLSLLPKLHFVIA